MARALIAAVFAGCLLLGQQTEISNAKELFERGQQSLAAGKYQDAERDFGQLIKMGVRSGSVYTNLGVV
jgi:outer membrane protein assembly factor BamD (BamD/ComL family)